MINKTMVSASGFSSLQIDLFYPIGSIFQTTSDINPNEHFGVGTWVKIENAFLFASGTKSVTSTGGEETHKLTVAEMPSHNHGPGSLSGYYKGRDIDNDLTGTIGSEIFYYDSFDRNASAGSVVINKGTTSNTGSSGAHNNMPPYYVVHIWHRIG